MEHERHFTLEEATALLPWAQARLDSIREALEVLAGDEAQAALARAAEPTGGAYADRAAAHATVTAQLSLAQLQGAGIVVRDAQRGLVDFPALRDGREVYLCWLSGEPRIEFWHEPDTGFAGRRPL
jgi:hypothetical protein